MSELSNRHSERGASNNCCKVCLKTFLTASHADHFGLSDLAAVHGAWRHTIFKAVNEFIEDTGNKTREAEGMLELPLAPHR